MSRVSRKIARNVSESSASESSEDLVQANGHGVFGAKRAQQPAVERRFCVEHLSLDQDLSGELSPDHRRKVSRSEHHAEPAAWECQSCAARTYPIIARCDKIGAGAERCTAHDRNRQCRRTANRLEQILERAEALPQLRIGQPIDIAEIGTGAEAVTGTVENDRASVALECGVQGRM